MNKKDDILDKLFGLQRFGIKPGLDRTFELLDKIGNPHNKLKSIHIAGTNGKGSISSIISSILYEFGLKVGLYTSPHIKHFNERLRINNKEISDDAIINLAEHIIPLAEPIGCTFFEITTAMAFYWFKINNVDIAIIETGMGGRFDSTNVITPLISIISHISLDHNQYLGNSLKEIALEKAGIIKPKTPLILSSNTDEVKNAILEIAYKNESEVIYPQDFVKIHNVIFNKDFTMNFDCSIFHNKNLKLQKSNFKNFYIPLAGNHQIENIATSIACISTLIELNDPLLKNKLSIFKIDEIIKKGLSNLIINTGLIARCQLIRDRPPIIIDVAHNPDAIESLIDTIKLCGYDNYNWNVLFGVMEDKDYKKMLALLGTICSSAIITKPKIQRAASILDLTESAKMYGINISFSSDSVITALNYALSKNRPLIISGSFYLIEEVISSLVNDQN